MNGNEVSTRSLSFTDYYWYNGQKIGINKLNNKKYILFDENNENTLKSASNLNGNLNCSKELEHYAS
ncbi:hypothetical protein NXY25_13475 [Bacteroides thetaiotaomicron]|nr:hypothetical protein [Bacteroides thetaiotaomicron]